MTVWCFLLGSGFRCTDDVSFWDFKRGAFSDSAEYFPCKARLLHLARRWSAACAGARLAADPFHVFRAASCSARPKEKLNVHGTTPAAQMAFNRSVAATSLCPPERKTIPGTAAGTVRRKQRIVASATSATVACFAHFEPDKTIPVFRSTCSIAT